MYGVNCWHENEVESVAMWKLYTHGKDVVAIQTKLSNLKSVYQRNAGPSAI
jgi:hypothetical protein